MALARLAGPLCFAGNHSRQSISVSKSILCCKSRQAAFWLALLTPSLNPVEMRLPGRSKMFGLPFARNAQAGAARARRAAKAHAQDVTESETKTAANQKEGKRNGRASSGSRKARHPGARARANRQAIQHRPMNTTETHQKPAQNRTQVRPESSPKATRNRAQTRRKAQRKAHPNPAETSRKGQANHRATQAKPHKYPQEKTPPGSPPRPPNTSRATRPRAGVPCEATSACLQETQIPAQRQ